MTTLATHLNEAWVYVVCWMVVALVVIWLTFWLDEVVAPQIWPWLVAWWKRRRR